MYGGNGANDQTTKRFIRIADFGCDEQEKAKFVRRKKEHESKINQMIKKTTANKRP